MPGGYRKLEDLPQVIPVFPLDGALLLPGGQLPLNIFEPRYVAMIDDAMAGERMIGMIQTRHGGDEDRPKLAKVGCAGRITRYTETGDGRYLITLNGVCRFGLGDEIAAVTPYRQIRADYGRFAADLEPEGDDLEFDRPPFLALLRRYLDHKGLGVEWETVSTAPAAALINSLSMALPLDAAEKQALIEAASIDDRRAALAVLLEIDAAEGDDGPHQVQ